MPYKDSLNEMFIVVDKFLSTYNWLRLAFDKDPTCLPASVMNTSE